MKQIHLKLSQIRKIVREKIFFKRFVQYENCGMREWKTNILV